MFCLPEAQWPKFTHLPIDYQVWDYQDQTEIFSLHQMDEKLQS